MLINETQKTAVLKTDDDDLRADLAQSRENMRLYTIEVEQVLNVVQKLVDQLEQEVSHRLILLLMSVCNDSFFLIPYSERTF